MTNQCPHGQLRRVCALCEKDAEIARLESAVKLAGKANLQLSRAIIRQQRAIKWLASYSNCRRPKWLLKILEGVS